MPVKLSFDEYPKLAELIDRLDRFLQHRLERLSSEMDFARLSDDVFDYFTFDPDFYWR